MQLNARAFEGVISLLVTPFTADGSIDWDAYDRYVEWHALQPVTALFAVCGSGEMAALDRNERIELAARAVRRAGPLPVLATGNLESDPEARNEEMRRLIDAGASGIVLVPAPEAAGKPERLYDYFASLADSAGVPVVLYEWPNVKPCRIEPDVFRRLTDRGVVGIKDTTATREGIERKIRAAPGAVVYQACTPYLIDAMEAGARGVMAITSTVFPDMLARFWRRASTATGSPEAICLHRRLVLLDALLRMGHPATAKHLLSRRGLPFDSRCRGRDPLPPDVAKALDIALPLLEMDGETGVAAPLE